MACFQQANHSTLAARPRGRWRRVHIASNRQRSSRRITRFPEGSSLPLENNLDYMNGVDSAKLLRRARTYRSNPSHWCCAQTYRASVILPSRHATAGVHYRRRYVVHSSAPISSHRSTLKAVGEATGGKPARGKAAGKFTTGIHNVGLGCLRLEQVNRWTDATSSEASSREDGLELSAMSADGETTLLVRPWIPSWWPKEEQEQIGLNESATPALLLAPVQNELSTIYLEREPLALALLSISPALPQPSWFVPRQAIQRIETE